MDDLEAEMDREGCLFITDFKALHIQNILGWMYYHRGKLDPTTSAVLLSNLYAALVNPVTEALTR